MGNKTKMLFVVMFGLLMAAGIPYFAVPAAQADPGCGIHGKAGPGCGCGQHAGCGCGHKAACGCGHHDGCGCGHKASCVCGEECGCGPDEGCGCGQKAGCGCEHRHARGGGQEGAGMPCCAADNTAPGPGGMHARMHGGKDAPAMKGAMTKHLEGMKEKIRKLREVEARMAGQVKDGEAFRASSLEHAKLLTDLQESHLKHMEGMMGGGK